MSGLRTLVVLLVLVVAAVVGCGGRGVTYDREVERPPHPFTQIKLGMTEEEVIGLLGAPTRRGKDIEYLNDAVKTANKEHILYWDTPQLGKIDVKIAGGRVHSRMKK